MLAISQEFGKSVDWLLTGKEHTEERNECLDNIPKRLKQNLSCAPAYFQQPEVMQFSHFAATLLEG
jgi:hypothetical protein